MHGDGNRAAADETIAAGLKRFPGDGTLLIESANIASWDGDWASASERWRKMRETWPDVWLGYSAGIAAARSSGDIEKSEQLYEEGEARFPHEVGLLMQGAWTAGEPVPRRFFQGIKWDQNANTPIVTYRCQDCGYLESYAPRA